MTSNWKVIAWWTGVIACFAALATGGSAFFSRQVSAYGALAVGLPQNAARDGLAFGWALNHRSKEEAEEKATEHCRASNQSEAAVAMCRVVETFAEECLAVALDREPGTRGVGWSVRQSLEVARAEAIAKCSATATPTREKFCELVLSRCDGWK